MSYVGNNPPQTTIPADDAVTTAMLKDDAVTSAKIDDLTIVNADINASAAIANSKMATDTTNASNLASGTVPTARLGSGSASSSTFLTGAQTYAAVDTSGITANKDDIALLAFRTQANGSLARYNLVDQSVDSFEDASGVDASASTDDNRDSSGKYYSGSVVGVETVTTWTSSPGGGTWTVPAGVTTAEILVVGGAGSGGSNGGGGAGGGGLVHHPTYSLTPAGTVTVTVGAGQARTTGSSIGVNGGDSVFGTLTAKGGGGGATNAGGLMSGLDGGSGGGPNWQASTGGGDSTQADFSGATSYGNDAGNGFEQSSPANWYAGGGGGAAGAGSNASAGTPSNGGPGQAFSISGGSLYYGAGGGGGTYGGSWSPGAGGTGGGGAGSSTGQGGDGTTYGSGGGGGGTTNGGGGAGYQGIVYAKYTPLSYEDMTLISNAQTAQSAPTKGDLVITYTNGAGTATVNTDIKAYISRNGSAYTSAVTLVSQGTTGGHTILTANDVDLSGITTGTSMRWKIETLNQAVGKQTRIHAVSLGWS